MLTSERAATARGPVHGPERAPEAAPRRIRIAATVLGLLGALFALAVPLLPIVQETATISWPQDEAMTPVNAPLAAFKPQELTAAVPCATAGALDLRTPGPATVLATTPPGSADGSAVGMAVLIEGGNLTVTSQGQVLGGTLLPPQPCEISIRSTADATTVTVGDQTVVDRTGDVRPQVTGVYTALQSSDPVDGLAVEITPDTRFQSTPHALKLAAMVLALACVVASLLLLHRLDARIGRQAPRLLPPRWWLPTGRDATVIAVLGLWVVIGGITSDDGYILTMIQTRDEMGYLGNYYRWLNVPEAPFSWPYELYALWAQLSTAPAWLRVPSFGMGVVSWLLISREVLPRLGREVRRSRAAGWAAAAVFLAFWLPYNNGLRLEPVVAIGTLLALCAVERAVATRRVAPLALGLLAAAFTVAATPTGLIAVAPFLVAVRPILRLVRQHAEVSRWPSVLAPMLGSGFLVLTVCFADQTWAGVLEASQLRNELGPSLSWYEEPVRYLALFSPSADGSLVRRFPVLVFLLCLGTCLAVALRRGGIPGAGLGPSRRLIGTAALSLVLIALTPTKWTHHFGAFATVAASLGALTALATSATVLRSARNRWWFLSGLLVVLALAATGPNAIWYVSSLGVPWFDKPPSFRGYEASTALIILAVVAAIVAAVLNARQPPGPPPPPEPPDRRRRALRIGSAPLTVICGLIVVAEILAMGKAMHKQRDSYSLGAANVAHIVGSSCNLSDAVLVERDRTESSLVPAASIEADDIPVRQGFERNSLPAAGSSVEESESSDEESESSGDQADDSQSDIEGDRGSAGSSDDENPLESPPPGLGGDALPIWSSFADGGGNTGRMRTMWFEMPDRALDGDSPVVVSTAGQVGPGTPITVELGRRTAEGIEVVKRVPVLAGATEEAPGWRDFRFDMSEVEDAETVRFTAEDNDITPEGWLAFAAPRVPQLTTMTAVVGAQTPVFMDWPVGFVHPCLRPFSIENGIAELPEYRLLPDDDLLGGSQIWSDGEGGGPFGWYDIVAAERELPTYLVGGWAVDWGELAVVEPRVAEAVAPEVVTGTEVRSGLWNPGPLMSIEDAGELTTTVR